MTPRRVVMISSTARDLPKHREQVRLACERAGFEPREMMENLTALNKNAVEVSLRMVEEADVYLGILAYRYGTIPKGYDLSITEIELNRAVELGKPWLVFLIHKDHPVVIEDVEIGPGAIKLKALKDRIGEERVAAFFKSPEDIRSHVVEALTKLAMELDTTETRDIAVSAAASRELIGRLSGVAAASTFTGKIEAFLEEYLVTEEGSGIVPFAGRDEELDRLDCWLDDAGASSRFLLTAPAGRGKSAVLVHWIKRLEMTGRVGDVEGSWSLVFMPISMRFSTNQPEVFYEAIAARLAEVLGENIKPAHIDPAAYYEDQCRLQLRQAIKRQKRILLVIDGLDEALGGRFDVSWFPRAPGPYLRLLVTARLQVGDQDSSGWVAGLGWTAGVRVQPRQLPILDVGGVRDLLLTAGAPVDVLSSRPEIVTKLHQLAEGEPLLLRLYVERLWQEGGDATRITIDDVNHIQPGFGGYFKDWLDRQRRAWDIERDHGAQIDEPAVLVYLAVLACAYGPVTSDELSELVRQVGGVMPGFRIENALYPLRRFVIGTGRRCKAKDAGYVLSHPKLGEYLRQDYFDQKQIARVQECFARWGREILRQLNGGQVAPDRVPRYLLQYLNQHFNDTSAPLDDIMQFVEEGWLRAWKAFEGGYRGFSRDVEAAAEAAHHRRDENFRSRELRCRLVLSSIASTGWLVDPKLVNKCAERGILPLRTALHWAEYQPVASRAMMVAGLMPLLAETDRAELLARTASAIRLAKDDSAVSTAYAVSALAPLLAAAERDSLLIWALSRVATIRDDNARVACLVELAKLLPGPQKAEALEKALATTKTVRDNEARVSCLAQIASALPQEERASILNEALDSARMIQGSGIRARALALIAAYLSGPDQSDAIAEALAAILSPPQWDMHDDFAGSAALARIAPLISDALLPDAFVAAGSLNESNQAYAKAHLAGRLQSNEQISVLTEALALARKYANRDPLNCAFTFIEIARHFTGQQQAGVLGEALATIREMLWTPYGIFSQLAEVADLLPNSLLADALVWSMAINDAVSRAHALAALASLLPEHEQARTFDQAVTVAESPECDKRSRVVALCDIVAYLPQNARAEVLKKALITAESIDGEDRARHLIAIAELLPDVDSDALLKEGIFESLKEEIFESKSDYVRATLLASLVPMLPLNERTLVIEEALGLGRAISDNSLRAEVLVQIAKQIPEKTRIAVLDEALATARSSKDGGIISVACAARSALLQGSDRVAATSEALSFAQEVQDDWSRCEALAAVAEALPEGERNAVLPILIEKIHSEPARAKSLRAIVKLLSNSQIPVVADAIESFCEDAARAQVLAAVMTRLSATDQDQALRSLLRMADKLTRKRFLDALPEILPILSRLEGVDGLIEVRRAILDVGRWFP